jgi:hypothetical protein
MKMEEDLFVDQRDRSYGCWLTIILFNFSPFFTPQQLGSYPRPVQMVRGSYILFVDHPTNKTDIFRHRVSWRGEDCLREKQENGSIQMADNCEEAATENGTRAST